MAGHPGTIPRGPRGSAKQSAEKFLVVPRAGAALAERIGQLCHRGGVQRAKGDIEVGFGEIDHVVGAGGVLGVHGNSHSIERGLPGRRVAGMAKVAGIAATQQILRNRSREISGVALKRLFHSGDQSLSPIVAIARAGAAKAWLDTSRARDRRGTCRTMPASPPACGAKPIPAATPRSTSRPGTMGLRRRNACPPGAKKPAPPRCTGSIVAVESRPPAERFFTSCPDFPFTPTPRGSPP